MPRHRAQRGVTIIEALVALLVGSIALLGLYQLVDTSNKLTKQQSDIADAQQSVRIGLSQLSRLIRQSRIGGLYYGNAVLPIANNIGGGTFMTDLSGAAHYIRKGTDVIEVRGVLSGDKYALDVNNVTCSGACDTTTQITVTIPATSGTGFVNFPAGGSPSLAGKTRPFYFVVLDGSNQIVTVAGSSYLVPLYTAGLVSTSGSWYTLTTNTFTFVMNPQDTGARKLNTTASLSSVLDKSVGGGAIDLVRFFVDEGPANATGSALDTHSSLAEATFDPSSGNYDIQTLVEEVEDFQVAYGVDGIDGTAHDGGISPAKVDESGSNKDEWVGNVANEIESSLPISGTDPKHVDTFIDTSVAAGVSNPLLANPALRSVWVSLVVKSTNPDLVYDGPGARGMKILDSTAVSFSAATGRPYRRRPLSLAVSLRNYN